MKKVLTLFMCLVLTVMLCGCAKDTANSLVNENLFSDKAFGKVFEMTLPEEWNAEEYKIEKSVMDNQVIYTGYDILNETDGGVMFTLHVTNDYPLVDGEKDVETYEAMFTAVGESKILYTNEEEGILMSLNTASDVQYDITSEEKSKHYMDMVEKIKLYSETFNVTTDYPER